MTIVAPSTPQLAALVARLVERRPPTRVIGIRAGARGKWPDVIEAGGRRFNLRWIVSALDAREQVLELESSNELAGLVLLTSLAEAELGSDLVGRLARARLHAVDPWQAAAQAFQATRSDPRLARHSWMADVLLTHRPPQGYPAVPGGFLDVDTAWRHALKALLGLDDPRPDAVALLAWLQQPDASARFAALPANLFTDVARWIESQGGAAAAAVMAVIHAGHAADAVPLGLVCRVLFEPTYDERTEIGEARGRVERFTGGMRVTQEVGPIWAGAAETVICQLQRNDPEAARRLLDAADRVARDLRISGCTRASPCLLSGFEGRLKDAAGALIAMLNDGSDGRLITAEAAVACALDHDQATVQQYRVDRLRMALRLARWLRQPERQLATDFAESIRQYADEGAFVDWARRTLGGGDDLADLATTYALILQQAEMRSEAAAERFAVLLTRWSSAPSPLPDVMLIEDVLEQVVAPLAIAHPVLLLILDGLGVAPALELLADIETYGWSMLRPATTQSIIGLAVIPSVTAVSRTALLTGRLGHYGTAAEKRGFAEHPALRRICGRRRPPQLLHKADIAHGASVLAAGVRDAIGAADAPIVGIVHNAIDDQLSGSSQLDRPWSLLELLGLPAVLHEARLAGRLVIITADHGHVLDGGTSSIGVGEGARWRRPDRPPTTGEISLAGPRVLTGDDTSEIIALWSERLRYGVRRTGYHGGVSPQEMLVPITVLCPPGVKPRIDWIEGRRSTPLWWAVGGN